MGFVYSGLLHPCRKWEEVVCISCTPYIVFSFVIKVQE